MIDKLLQSLLVFCSYFVPKNPNFILLGAGDTEDAFRGNPKYFYFYLSKSEEVSNIKSNWITSDKSLYQKLKKVGLPVVYKYSLKGFYFILRSQYLIVECSIRDVTYTHWFCNSFGRFSIIQAWHGVPLKNIGADIDRDKKSLGKKIKRKIRDRIYFLDDDFLNPKSKYKFVCSTSKSVSKKLETAFPNRKIKTTGYPRNDIFFKESMRCENYKEKFNLKFYDKIFLYAPTWRDGMKEITPFSRKTVESLNNFLLKNNYFFLVKRHPWTSKISNLENFDNIIDVTESAQDIQELLVDIDVLITDYSSVFFDFMLANNPIIFYPYDYEQYIKNCREMYYDYFEDLPGPFAKSEMEFLGLVKNIGNYFQDYSYKKKYKTFKDKIHKYQDSSSSKRLLEEINKLKNEKSNYLRNF